MSDPDYVGGFVLIPKARGKHTFVEAAGRFYDQVMASNTFVPGPIAQLLAQEPIPRATWISQVSEYDRVHTFFDIESINCFVNFDALAPSYYSIEVSAHQISFDATQDDFSKEQVDLFASAWSRICEAVEAEYGYFNQLSSFLEEEFRDEEIIPPLGQRDMQDLVKSAQETHWLSYLGPELVALMTPQLWELLEGTEVTKLPSGALFVKSRQAPFYYLLDA